MALLWPYFVALWPALNLKLVGAFLRAAPGPIVPARSALRRRSTTRCDTCRRDVRYEGAVVCVPCAATSSKYGTALALSSYGISFDVTHRHIHPARTDFCHFLSSTGAVVNSCGSPGTPHTYALRLNATSELASRLLPV